MTLLSCHLFLYSRVDISERDTFDNRIHILSDGTLMIQSAGSEDVGQYECMARNSAGEVKSLAYSLSLIDQSELCNVCLHVSLSVCPPDHSSVPVILHVFIACYPGSHGTFTCITLKFHS